MQRLNAVRRDKVFGSGNPRPLPRKIKQQIWKRALELKQKTEPRKHYGVITGKHLDVLRALLWGSHNEHTGLCFPSYERIAELAGCARSTVYEAIKALERAGLLTWVNRLVRIADRVLRTSNGYRFTLMPVVIPNTTAPKPHVAKSEITPGTGGQATFLKIMAPDPGWEERLKEDMRTRLAGGALNLSGAALTGR